MTKSTATIGVLLLISASAVWPQNFADKPWSMPKQEMVCWLSSTAVCKIELMISLDGSEQAANAYWGMSKIWKTPLEKQIMARVQRDVSLWWQQNSHHTKQGLMEAAAKSISVLPKGIRCRVWVTTILMIPPPTVEETTYQVQPTVCTILFVKQNILSMLTYLTILPIHKTKNMQDRL